MPRNVTNSSDLNLLGKFPPEGTEFIYPLHNDRVNMWFLVRVLCSWVCPWILLRPHHRAKCWLSVPAFYLSSCFLPRDVQGRLRSNKLLNWTVSCEIGNFVSSNPTMSMDTIRTHSVLDGDLFWHWRTNKKIVLSPWRAFRTTWLPMQILTYISC